MLAQSEPFGHVRAGEAQPWPGVARLAPHAEARDAFVKLGRTEQPAPAPRFSRTPAAVRGPTPERGEGGKEALQDWGFTQAEVGELEKLGLGFL